MCLASLRHGPLSSARPDGFLDCSAQQPGALRSCPFLPRFELTVASTPALVSAPFCNAFFSAAAKAWLAAIS
jgi:hypothetical protein